MTKMEHYAVIATMYCTVWICPIAIRLWRSNSIVRMGPLFLEILDIKNLAAQLMLLITSSHNQPFAWGIFCGVCNQKVPQLCINRLHIGEHFDIV